MSKKKNQIRARMAKTGEGWQTAQRHVRAKASKPRSPELAAPEPAAPERYLQELGPEPNSDRYLVEFEADNGLYEEATAASVAALAAMGLTPATLTYLDQLRALRQSLDPALKAVEAAVPLTEVRRVGDLLQSHAVFEAEQAAQSLIPRDPFGVGMVDRVAGYAQSGLAAVAGQSSYATGLSMTSRLLDSLKPDRGSAVDRLTRSLTDAQRVSPALSLFEHMLGKRR